MRAGALNRLIAIEKNTPTRAASGAPVEAWSSFASVWANKRDIGAAEGFTAGRDLARVVSEFTIRYLADVTTAMRISYDGDLYDIEGVREIGRRVGLTIVAVLRGA